MRPCVSLWGKDFDYFLLNTPVVRGDRFIKKSKKITGMGSFNGSPIPVSYTISS